MEKKNVIGNKEKRNRHHHMIEEGEVKEKIEFSSLSESIFNQILLT